MAKISGVKFKLNGKNTWDLYIGTRYTYRTITEITYGKNKGKFFYNSVFYNSKKIAMDMAIRDEFGDY